MGLDRGRGLGLWFTPALLAMICVGGGGNRAGMRVVVVYNALLAVLSEFEGGGNRAGLRVMVDYTALLAVVGVDGDG